MHFFSLLLTTKQNQVLEISKIILKQSDEKANWIYLG